MIIENILLTLQPFVGNLNSLKPGVNHFKVLIGKEFFDSFENREILNASLEVGFSVFSHGSSASVQCSISGFVSVSCDRCLEELPLAVNTEFEEKYMPESAELDISQDVYDYICCSLPLQRVHPEGECNEETTKFICK